MKFDVSGPYLLGYNVTTMRHEMINIDVKFYRVLAASLIELPRLYSFDKKKIGSDMIQLCDHIDAQQAEIELKEKQLNGNVAILDAAADRIEQAKFIIRLYSSFCKEVGLDSDVMRRGDEWLEAIRGEPGAENSTGAQGIL